jgi:hypothetical protein
MNIDPKFFPIIAGVIGLVGVAFGSLLSEFRNALESRRNTKKILKSALFHQFELFGEMLAFDRDSIDEFLQSLKEALSEFGIPDEVINDASGKLPNSIIKTLQNALSGGEKEIFERHEAIMLKLSEIDPLFAINWSYRSRSKIPERMKGFFNEVSNIAEEKTETGEKFLIHIQQWYQLKAQKRLLNSIEEGIIKIALRISYWTWWKTKRELKTWKHKGKKDIKIEVKEYLHEVVRFARETGNDKKKDTDLPLDNENKE